MNVVIARGSSRKGERWVVIGNGLPLCWADDRRQLLAWVREQPALVLVDHVT